jgi:hypothetical protein
MRYRKKYKEECLIDELSKVKSIYLYMDEIVH